MSKDTSNTEGDNALDAFFGPGAADDMAATQEYLDKARREDGVDYAEHMLWGGKEAFVAHRNEVRAKRGLPPINA
jgi:hypothetical protein